jgi:hypothetical protein
MKILTFLLFALSSLACTAAPDKQLGAFIPVSINQVQMDVIEGHIVRVIQHNMELNPVLQFELMTRPRFEVVDHLTLTSIPFNGEELSFKDSSGAFVEAVKIREKDIVIDFDYFYLKGGEVLLNCILPVKEGKFLAVSCTRK